MAGAIGRQWRSRKVVLWWRNVSISKVFYLVFLLDFVTIACISPRGVGEEGGGWLRYCSAARVQLVGGPAKCRARIDSPS